MSVGPDLERPNRALKLIVMPLWARAFSTAERASSRLISLFRENCEWVRAFSRTRS